MARKDLNDVGQLKRHLTRIGALDGKALWLAEGLHLVWIDRILDAPLLAESCGPAGIPVAILRRAARHRKEPVSVDAPWLATIRRDLRLIEGSPYRRSLARESRILRKLGTFDDAWFARCHARIDFLGGMLRAKRGSPATHGWLRNGILELVAVVHGEDSARALDEVASAAWNEWFGAEALAERIAAFGRVKPPSDGPRWPPRTVELEPFQQLLSAAAARLAAPLGEKETRDDRLRQLVQELVAWPFRLEQLPTRRAREENPLPRRMDAAVEHAGEEAIARLATGRDAPVRRAMARFFEVVGLWFPCESGDRLDAAEAAGVLAQWPSTARLSLIARWDVCLQDALRLGSIRVLEHANEAVMDRCAALVERGFPVQHIHRLARASGWSRQLGLESLTELQDVDALKAWAEWFLRLEPAYARAGFELDFPPRAFAGVKGTKSSELATLAQCLFEWRASPERRDPDRQLLLLDLVMSLQGASSASRLTSVLGDAPAGIGLARCPEFARWLGDARNLDHLLHLQQLAGEGPVASRRLLADFEAERRLRGQVDHLESLPHRTSAQERRLDALRARLAAENLPGPGRTSRRLEAAVGPARGRAILCQLDRCAREAISARWGVVPDVLTDAWLDALRYLVVAEENRELLDRAVRFAAEQPGRPIWLELAPNRAWVTRARRHLDAEAWLAQREREVEIRGRRYRLSTEEDPIEILRMGLPFHTCLSIQKNSPGRSPVLNAVDANKRVLYLRDERGAILARKLLAISADWKLLGYRLYSVLGAEARPAVDAAFGEMCSEIARAAGLEWGSAGAPEQIHAGVWWDDGVVPLDGHDVVAAYCRYLGRSRTDDEWVRSEAVGWHARQREDVEAAIAALRVPMPTSSSVELGNWIVERLGFEAALRRARSAPELYEFLFSRVAQGGVPAVLDLLERTGGDEAACWQTCFWLWQLPDEPGTALRLAQVGVRSARRREGPRRSGMEYISRFLVPQQLAVDPVETVFDVCDVLEPVWASHARKWPDNCRWRTGGLAEGLLAHDERPDEPAVARCLESPRRSILAVRTAIEIAAVFPFSKALGGRVVAALRALGRRWPELGRERSFAEAVANAQGEARRDSRARLLATLGDPRSSPEAATDALDRWCAAQRSDPEVALAIRRFVKAGRRLPPLESLRRALQDWNTREHGALRHAWAEPGLREAMSRAFCADASDGGLEEFCAVALRTSDECRSFVREVFSPWEPRFVYSIFTPWIRALALDTALEVGPRRCVESLGLIVDARTASAFIDRIVAKYPPPRPDDPPLHLESENFRHRWLIEAWERAVSPAIQARSPLLRAP